MEVHPILSNFWGSLGSWAVSLQDCFVAGRVWPVQKVLLRSNVIIGLKQGHIWPTICRISAVSDVQVLLGSHFIDEGLLQHLNPVLNIVQQIQLEASGLGAVRCCPKEGRLGAPSSSTELSITTARVQAFQRPLVMLSAVSDLHFETSASNPLLFFFPPPSQKLRHQSLKNCWFCKFFECC